MAFSPNNFWHNANKNLGFAKSNRFIVTIQIPRITGIDDELGRSLQLQCETAELPGKNLVTQDVKVYGPTYKVATHKQFANEITLNFLCTNTGIERNIFDAWIEYINPNKTMNMRFPGGIDGIEGSYMSSMTITHYSDLGNAFDFNIRDRDRQVAYNQMPIKINEVTLTDSFPIGYAAQPLNWGDDGFQRLSVQFAYRRFVNNSIPGANPITQGVNTNDVLDLDNESGEAPSENLGAVDFFRISPNESTTPDNPTTVPSAFQ